MGFIKGSVKETSTRRALAGRMAAGDSADVADLLSAPARVAFSSHSHAALPLGNVARQRLMACCPRGGTTFIRC